MNNNNIMSKKNLADTNNFSKEFQFNFNNNISTLNNFHKTKYEDIKNSSNKEDKMNYNNYKLTNKFSIHESKYPDIKKNLISTAINSINNRNNVNIYNSPKLNHKQNKSNHFNKTYKNNNNNLGFNKNNIFIKYHNEQQNDKSNLLSERSKGDIDNEKNEFKKELIKLDLYNEGLNDNYYNEYQNSGSAKSDDDDEPDPRINFEQINQINKSRPLTSYGGLNARRKNLQSALQKNKINRPVTSYNINNY